MPRYHTQESRLLCQKLEIYATQLPQKERYRIALQGIAFLLDVQSVFPPQDRMKLWYVEGIVAFPKLRTYWSHTWIERENDLIDPFRAYLEATETVYFPIARYRIPSLPENLQDITLPLVDESDPFYRSTHDVAVLRALAEDEEQYYQTRASALLPVCPDLLIEGIIDKNPLVIQHLPSSRSPEVQAIRENPEWVGQQRDWPHA